MRDPSLISTVWHFYLHLCNVMRQTRSTKWHRFDWYKALCTETKLRNLRVLLVDYYAVKVNSWYTIKTLLPNGRQIFYYSILYCIEDMLASWLDVRKKSRSEREVYFYIWENYKYFWFTKNVVTNVRFTIILNCDIPQILFLSVSSRGPQTFYIKIICIDFSRITRRIETNEWDLVYNQYCEL